MISQVGKFSNYVFQCEKKRRKNSIFAINEKNFHGITFSVIGVKPDKSMRLGEDIQKIKMVFWEMVKRYETFISLSFLSVFKGKALRKLKVSRKAQEVS